MRVLSKQPGLMSCKKTEQLKNDPAAVERVKQAKVVMRDVLLWRWSGLTGWMYNQTESEFFHSYGREIESQLMNSVAKIRQKLLQELMRRPAWKKLQAKLVSCAATNSWTPELYGLLNRFWFLYWELGGPKKPGLQEFRMLEDHTKILQEIALEEERECEEEAAFANEVWNLASHRVSDSMLSFLCMDDDSNDPVALVTEVVPEECEARGGMCSTDPLPGGVLDTFAEDVDLDDLFEALLCE